MSEREMTAMERAAHVLEPDRDPSRGSPPVLTWDEYRRSIAHQCEAHAAAATAELRAEVERLTLALDVANKAERHARQSASREREALEAKAQAVMSEGHNGAQADVHARRIVAAGWRPGAGEAGR